MTHRHPHATPPPKRIIICADDFAINASVSLGIAALAAQGRISAASVMVLSPRWAQDASLLRPVCDRIDVGLHLDWTSSCAQSSGHGMSLEAAMCRAVLGGFDVSRSRAVIDKQLDLFERHWHRPPDYVDGHQHVQQFSGIRSALVEVLTHRYAGLPCRPYLRISRPPRGAAYPKARLIALMGADALIRIAHHAQLTGVTSLLGVYDFAGGASRFGTLMVQWLAQIPNGGIIMCHPAQAAEPGDALGVARWQEFVYLGGIQFLADLQCASAELARGPHHGMAHASPPHPPP